MPQLLCFFLFFYCKKDPLNTKAAWIHILQRGIVIIFRMDTHMERERHHVYRYLMLPRQKHADLESWSSLCKQVIICGVGHTYFSFNSLVKSSLLRSLSTSLLQLEIWLQSYFSYSDVCRVSHCFPRKDVFYMLQERTLTMKKEVKNQFVPWTLAKHDCNPFESRTSFAWVFFFCIYLPTHRIIWSRAGATPRGVLLQ
jgi:hypothetical protein